MQHSSVSLSSLTTLLGLDPTAAGDGSPTPGRGPGSALDDEFAALLAAIGAPPGGEVLPADGKVLPLDSAARAPALADVRAAASTLPAPAPGAVVAEMQGTMQREIAVPHPAAAQAPAPGNLPSLVAAETVASEAPAHAPPQPPRSAPPSPPSPPAVADLARAPAAALPAGTSSPAPPEVSAGAEPIAPSPPEPAAPLRASTGAAPTSDVEAALDPAARVAELGDPARRTDAAAEGSTETPRPMPRSAAVSLASEPGVATSATTGPAAAAPPVAPGESAADIQPSSPARAHDRGVDARGTPAELGESMAGRIRVLIDQGAGEARLRINPPELGTIDVRISMLDDKTFVQMTASHAAGRDALEQSLPRLRELLAAGGLDLGGASVGGGAGDARSGSGLGRPDAPHAYREAAVEAGQADSAAPRLSAPASGLVDLFA